MKNVSKGIKGALGVGVAAAVTLSIMPVGSAYALGSLKTWQPPSGKTDLTITQDGQTKTLITSSSHKALEGTADALGISNVTCTPFAANPYVYEGTAQQIYEGYDNAEGVHQTGVSESARFGIYGSDVNEQKNPYYANYFYNAYQNYAAKGADLADAKSTLLLDTSSGNPLTADTNVIDQYGTSAALYYRPDILLAAGSSPRDTSVKDADGNAITYGDALTTTSGYTELVNKIRNKELGSYEGQDLSLPGDENYDPYYVTAAMGSWKGCFTTLYGLADAADDIMYKDSSKTTRYGDPEKIATGFESYVLGTQDAVLKAIDEGTVKKKTVAVVKSVNTETNTVTLNANGDSSGSDGGITVGCLQNVTDNLADKLGKTEVTAQELMENADLIYIGNYMGFSSQSSIDAAVAINDELTTVLKAGGYTDESAYPDTFVQGPKAVIHARVGTVDGASYLGTVIGFAYPEVINPVNATAYFYQNFYHIKASRLADALGLNLATTSLPKGYELSLSDYDEDAYQKVIDDGLAYYNSHKDAIESAHSTLAASARINPTDLSSATVTLSDTSYTYDGKAKEPTVSVSLGNTTLKQNTDYRVSYSDNTNAGTATVTVTGIREYTGKATTSFAINRGQLASGTITLSTTSYTYDGTAKTPTPTVTYDGATLKAGTDYTVAYANNTNAGTATATITGQGDYNGTLSTTFTINQAALSNANITLADDSYTYDGKAKEPATTVRVGGNTLSSGDYTVAYANNTNAGTATATVTGRGNYSGTATQNFTINKAAGFVNAKNVSVKVKTVAKKKVTKKISVSASGKVSYKLSSAAKKAGIKVSGKKVTVKKGTKKGTYKVTVNSASTKNYKAAKKTISVKVA